MEYNSVETSVFIDPKTELPSPGSMCIILRSNNSVYIGHRTSKPLSIDKHPSQDCYWYGTPVIDLKIEGNSTLSLYTNFADVTVKGWRYFTLTPTAPAEEGKEAVVFVEWLGDNNYWQIVQDGRRIWMRGQVKAEVTTAELYQIFKQQNR